MNATSSMRVPSRALRYGPSVVALVYPGLLAVTDWLLTRARGGDALAASGAALSLLASFAVPASGLVAARALAREGATTYRATAERLALLAFVTPSLYVGAGTLSVLAHTPATLTPAWVLAFVAVVLCAYRRPASALAPIAQGSIRTRKLHGFVAALLVVFLGAHLTNHLAGLAGEAAHRAVLHALRAVYRHGVVEKLLVLVFAIQVTTGVMLARAPHGSRHGVLQRSTGAYVGVFIGAHALAVFVLGRHVLGLDTDWTFARGGPAGMLGSSVGVSLVPYYGYAVFSTGAHLATGLTGVLRAHDANERAVRRLEGHLVAASAIVAIAVLIAMLAA